VVRVPTYHNDSKPRFESKRPPFDNRRSGENQRYQPQARDAQRSEREMHAPRTQKQATLANERNARPYAGHARAEHQPKNHESPVQGYDFKALKRVRPTKPGATAKRAEGPQTVLPYGSKTHIEMASAVVNRSGKSPSRQQPHGS
jgi:hypothetical protein